MSIEIHIFFWVSVLALFGCILRSGNAWWKERSILNFFLFIELIGVTLVYNTEHISGAQFCNTLSVHCIVCSPNQVKFLSITVYSPYTLLHLLPSPLSWAITTLLSGSISFFSLFFLFLLTSSTHLTQPHSRRLSACYLWVCHNFAC